MDALYIVIPAYNEEANIESVAREWHDVVQRTGPESRLVIVDDGSRDGTLDILRRLQGELPQLLPLTKPNAGHGPTLLYGYRYALEQGADYVFQTDSDGQTLPEEFWPFWEGRHQYDWQIGFRKHRQDGWSRVLVTKTLRLVVFLSFGVWVTDANTPFRLMSAATLGPHLAQVPEGYNLTNVLLSVLYKRCPPRGGPPLKRVRGGNGCVNSEENPFPPGRLGGVFRLCRRPAAVLLGHLSPLQRARLDRRQHLPHHGPGPAPGGGALPGPL